MKKVIAHSVYPYLSLTQSWIYSQLIHNHDFHHIVVTDQKKNLDLFPYEHVFSISDSCQLQQLFLKAYKALFKAYTPFTKRLLRENQVSLLHSHFGNTGWRDLEVKKQLKLPQVTTFYGYDIAKLPRKQEWRSRYQRLFQECDLFTVEGPYMKQVLVGLGCPDEKVVVQHLGTDLNKIKFIPRKIAADGVIKVLIAGSFTEKKGIPYAVEAFAIARQKYQNLQLTIIGDGVKGKDLVIKEQILKIIQRYNIANAVNLLGYQPYSVLLEEAQKHHLFISPSVQAEDGDNEGGAPVSIIEMSASGMPVISTRHCDIPSVIIDGESGYLVEERNVEQIVERLEYLIENPQIWEDMGRAGRAHIEMNYDIVKQVRKMSELYSKLI
ncbi:MAG TPA: glycosyltransferase [Bacillota bacterium]|nr:glycosyltransferase [Bacillota bacterium]